MINRFLMTGLVLLLGFAAPAAHAAEDLCPDAKTARSTTPGDMAGVQSDIERLTLCVERAKLLKQLDDIAKQRADTLEKLKNPDFGKNGGISTGLGTIPPLPVSALPPIDSGKSDNKNLKPGEIRIHAPTGKPLDDALTSLTPGEWKVRKIWGQGAAMHAQLTDGRGTLVNVVKGDPLPDGPVVETISVKGVSISQGGKITDLSWDTGNSSPAAANNVAQATP